MNNNMINNIMNNNIMNNKIMNNNMKNNFNNHMNNNNMRNNINLNEVITKEVHIDGHLSSMSLQTMKYFCNQMELIICKIKKPNNINGTGFICKIPNRENLETKKCFNNLQSCFE